MMARGVTTLPKIVVDGPAVVVVSATTTANTAATSLPKSSLRARRTRPTLTLEPVQTTVDCLEKVPRQSPLESHGFTLGDILGRGSVGVVRKVTRTSDSKVLAAKHVHTEDSELQEFTHLEYNLLQSLRHPSILKVDSLITGPKDMWLITECCENGSVQTFVERQGPLSESAMSVLFLQLLEGVDFLHRKRIVHRDLKPDNLLLCNEGKQLRIADFNSARRLRGSSDQDDCGLMLSQRGTPLYLAPESVLGQDWNERVDVWAAGLCAYFMLSGRLPFRTRSQSIKEAYAAGKLPEASWELLPEKLVGLVQSCLTVDMRKRPSAMELLVHPAFNTEQQQQMRRSRSCIRKDRSSCHGSRRCRSQEP